MACPLRLLMAVSGCPTKQAVDRTTGEGKMKNLVYLAIVAALGMGFVAVEMGFT